MSHRNGSHSPKIYGLPDVNSEAELLRVKVVRAEGLAKKDIFGTSDPYVVVSLRESDIELDRAQTKTIRKNRNPTWNEEFFFRTTRNCKLFILVFDANRITRDDFLGQLEFDLAKQNIVRESVNVTEVMERNCVLNPRSKKSRVCGSLRLALSYTRTSGDVIAPLYARASEDVVALSYIGPSEEPATTLRLSPSMAAPPRSPTESRIASSAADILPEGWEERQDANGRTFYVNHILRTTQWQRPDVSEATEEQSVREDQIRRHQLEQRYMVTSEESPNNVQDHISAIDNGMRALFMGQANRTSSSATIPSTASSRSLDSSTTEQLPEGWEMQIAPNGRRFFIDHKNRKTTWTDPRSGKDSEKMTAARSARNVDDLGPLPPGWEERIHTDGRVFFIDHNRKKTQWDDPRFDNEKLAGPAIPYSRDFKRKQEYLRVHLPKPISSNAKCEMTIRRAHVFEDSFRQISQLSVPDLRSKLWIELEGETGLDYGGITREWLFLLSRQIFNPYYGLFEYSATDNYTLQVNPHSGTCNPEHLQYYHFIGRVIGIAIYHGKLLDAFFIRPFYKMLLGKPITLMDMESVDNEYFNSLVYIKENDPVDLNLQFCVDEDVFGETKTSDLKPNGRNIEVADENRDEYIDLIIKWRFVSRVEPQMEAILKGIHELIPANLLQLFDSNELELLMCGIQKIDVKDWRDNTQYKGGYTANNQVVHNFWKCILSFNNEMRARVLQFVTGTSRVPMNGFAELYGSNGPQKFTIEQWGHPDMLPRAHTCFNRIDLPPYSTYQDLKEKLCLAIENSEIFAGVD
ncbi:hypothetical protein QR680_008987 [Steinernema hermaphroditum]|uniref:E3 ubiquitin-protein ligase n=1 Tax=Steinernema hermaphroditum TaxID=289476 RepID=A0AA39IIL9_9BILA|nr:hypothetical protein QR680_008987 [Steinernema hermaphroditum]